MADEAGRSHVSMTINMTLDELDAELGKSYGDATRSRILEAARAAAFTQTISPQTVSPMRDGGTHGDVEHIDFWY